MESVIVERTDSGVVTVTMNRPHKKNAVDYPMWERLAGVFQEVGRSATDRVLVLTGAEGAFCAGADLSSSGAPRHPLDAMHYVNETGLALHQVPKPCIAKVNGVAAGAGMNLALGCDLIVAGESARFSEIFARRGLSLDMGGAWLLPRIVGLHKAKELALLADVIDAREAERIGIVNRVVPGWAERLAAGPPLALQMSKRLLDSGLQMGLAEMLHWEAMAQSINLSSRDAAEAFEAFLQKREPTFRGR